ncbi:MAG: 2-polyprenyl-3-methyl-6-methoxy-1,4-benzoquinone monooxygenase [SAR86 cluster bacterium]|jgi:3-demethoxyubiquinol 3-hydroxylase|nr:2-polyprenyl-3-methyl-6-methoxy-1,4-benzoquinone monooxygenase [SAR86 cluster bacterium]
MTKFIDSLILELDKGIKYSIDNHVSSKRKYPARELKKDLLSSKDRNHSSALMRVNHTGEVCAQALYRGQASTAKLKGMSKNMEKAAEEELDHLAWCNERLDELNASPSIFNPIWYGLSFSLGALTGLIGDKFSLGFVEETEKQVVKHLEGHLEGISDKDERSKVIIKEMRADEEEHASKAHEAGAEELPSPVKKVMSVMAKIMTTTSYRI